MAKGYLNDLPLQTNLAAESSTFTVILTKQLWRLPAQIMFRRLLTMNSVARHVVTD